MKTIAVKMFPVSLLLAFAVSLGIMGQTPAFTQAPVLRVRRSQKDLPATEKQVFVDAIKALRDAPAKGDKTKTTNRLDEFVLLHNLSDPHAADLFLPWHRKMLLDFENEVRALSGPQNNPNEFKNFTVPYWDWTKDSFPSHLCETCQDNLFMGPDGDPTDKNLVKAGPFAGWDTTESLNGTKNLQRRFVNIGQLKTDGSASIPNVLGRKDYKSFSLGLEGHDGTKGMHNDAHGRVGGHLGNPQKGADDPTFWMLHAYVDLVWAKWECGPGSLNSYDPFSENPDFVFPTFHDEGMRGFGDALGTSLGFTEEASPDDELNYFNLGYTYEYMGAVFTPATCPEPSALAFALASIGLFCLIKVKHSRRKSRS